jgi:hypothetical protein
MSLVRASIEIAAAPERVWDLVMDPCRLGEWVTIHSKLVDADSGPPRPGFRMRQRLQLHGVPLDVRWTLVDCQSGRGAVWEGRGPARSRARTEYVLTPLPDDAGHDAKHTRFDYRNEFHPPLGYLGALAARALERGMPRREATLTLQRLRDLLERDHAPAR